MTEQEYVNALLEAEKNMTHNLSIYLNEASNKELLDQFKEMFDNVLAMQQKIFALASSFGWYKLENVDTSKIKQKYDTLNQKQL